MVHALFPSFFPRSPKADSARSLSVDEMYLCDSGAQYWDGTTDVTRTVHFGTPTHFQKVPEIGHMLSALLLMVVYAHLLVSMHLCVHVYVCMRECVW